MEVGALVNAAHGSVFDTITTKTFEASRVVLPPSAVLKAFEERAAPHFLRMLQGSVECHTLTALRNTLLPKLISGELRIFDAQWTDEAGGSRGMHIPAMGSSERGQIL